MSDSERAARHLALPQIGEIGQQGIAETSALLIGAGGIGCAVAQYLTAAGMGALTIVDFDTVDATNLARQVLFTPDDTGKPKAEVAALRLSKMNPDIQIKTVCERADDGNLPELVRATDIVLDGCDNFSTRFAVNDACVSTGTTLISGSAIRFEGQLAVFGPDYSTSPCYRCLYEEADESLENCAGNGVLSPVPGVIGTSMAVECLKIAAGIEVATGRVSLYDGLASEWRAVKVPRRAGCPACGVAA